MKKDKSFGKIAMLPDTPPASQIKPGEAAQTNKNPIITQPNTNSPGSAEENIRIPNSLRAQLAAEAQNEGVSLSEYIIYKLTR